MVFQRFFQTVQHVRNGERLDRSDGLFKFFPEVRQNGFPFLLAFGNVVKRRFQIGGEVVLDVLGKEVFHERGDQSAAVFGNKAAFFQTDVFSVLQNGQNRRVGRRTPDAQFFQFFDKAGFGIAGRRLGEVLFGAHVGLTQEIPRFDGRQKRVVFFVRVVQIFMIDFQKAVERHRLPVCAESDLPVARGAVDADFVDDGGLHLRRRRALPNQFVEFELVFVQHARQRIRTAFERRGADGFVRFLRVFDVVFVIVRLFGQIRVAVIGRDDRPDVRNRFRRHLQTVGTHIGNQTDGFAAQVDAFVQLLGDLHGLFGGKEQFTRRFLLQSRGRERGGGVTLDRFAFNLPDVEIRL